MIVTLGEPMMVFNGPPDAPIGIGAQLGATFAGAEANVAIGLARLGHTVRYLTAVGDDPFGRTIIAAMGKEGVDVSHVRFEKSEPTGVMFKNWGTGPEPDVFYYRGASAFARLGADGFESSLWREAKLVYLTGITPALSEGCLALFRRVIADAGERGIPVWLDPNYRAKLWSAEAFRETLAEVMPMVDTILPGLSEGQTLTGETKPDAMAAKLLVLGAKNVVIKADGQAIAYASGTRVACPAFAIDRVVDPIGAGDAFGAAYLSASLDGLPIAERLRRGHAAAAMVCMTRGDWEGLPKREGLDHFLTSTGR